MNFNEILETTNIGVLRSQSKLAAANMGLSWDRGVQKILLAAKANPQLAASVAGTSLMEVLEKWLGKYKVGFENRVSKRRSKPPGTVPDAAVDVIVSSRLPHLSSADSSKIRLGHRLAMSAENILGLMLEEYLSIELAEFGWHACWGETMRSMDFVNEDGRLMQVKNRSNSENSSSNKVRAGTKIEKWHRVNATKGSYEWEKLNLLHKTTKFSEKSFLAFVANVVRMNPHCLFVEDDNPWKAS